MLFRCWFRCWFRLLTLWADLLGFGMLSLFCFDVVLFVELVVCLLWVWLHALCCCGVVVFVNCAWCVVALLCGLLLGLLVRGLLLIVLLCACCLVCCMFMGIW